MSETINIQMNRWNGTDYDILHPEAMNNPNMIIADTMGAIVEPNIIVADKLKTARLIGNASFDGSANITSTQMGVSKLATESTITFLASGWVLNGTTNCYEQSVVCAGLLATDTEKDVDIYIVGNDNATTQAQTDLAASMVDRMVCSVDGYLYARSPSGSPSVDFSVKVVQHR